MVSADACPGAPTLLAYVEGRLAGEARDEAEVHLDQCAECLTAVAELARSTDRPGGTSDGREPHADSQGAARYEIGAQVARGGMGRIVRAWDRTLGRTVALKTVADDGSAPLMQRLRREMALTARLQHPSIVPIYDAGLLDNGEPYYAMRWIEGRTLRELIDACGDAGQRLALLPVVLSLAEAIAYAHDQGILHRDIKPSNIVVGTFGETVVLDWGLAKDLQAPGDLDETQDRSAPAPGGGLTADGQIMGTPGYIAPEQLLGEDADPRVDVYAVGIILLELATGTVPTCHELGRLYGSVDRNVPPDLATIIRRATHREPGCRYRDGTELVSDLRRYAQGRLVLAHQYTVSQYVRRFVARHRVSVGLAAAFLAALAGGGSWAVARIVEERDAANEANAVAQEQRTLALEQRTRAAQRRDAAQTLVQFIVKDLGQSLEHIGRSDLLAVVATSALEYFEGVDEDNADATDLVHASEALHGLGSALVFAGDAAGAGRAYAGALTRAEQAAARGNADATWWTCSARERLGYVASATGDRTRARELLQRVVHDAQDALGSDPDPSRWAVLVGPALLSLYTLDAGDGELDRAQQWLTQAERLATTPVGDPNEWGKINADLRLAVLQYRAREARDAGDLAGYRAATNALVEQAREAYEADADDAGRQGNYVAALMDDASARQREGDAASAVPGLKIALELSSAAVVRDPSNVRNRALRGTTLQFLASNARERDALVEATDFFAAAEAEADEIRRLAPDDVEMLRTQSASSAKYLGVVLQERAEHELALAAFVRALEALQRAYTIDPQHPQRLRDVVPLTTLAARSALALGRIEAATRHAERALSVAREVAQAGAGLRDQLALADALAVESALARRQGETARGRAAADEARTVLGALQPSPDPVKSAALHDELTRLWPTTD